MTTTTTSDVGTKSLPPTTTRDELQGCHLYTTMYKLTTTTVVELYIPTNVISTYLYELMMCCGVQLVNIYVTDRYERTVNNHIFGDTYDGCETANLRLSIFMMDMQETYNHSKRYNSSIHFIVKET